MTKNEIVGRLKDGGLDASSTNRRAAVYVADAIAGRAVPGWFAFRIVCDSEDTERRARAILSRWYDIDVGGNGVWRMRSKNRVPLMAIKRGGPTPPPPTPTDGPMYFEAAEANSTVSLMSGLSTAPNLEYSTDGETWQEWQHTTAGGTHTFDTLTLGTIGDRVYLRGDNPNGLADLQSQQISNFSMTGKINAGGNIMSLLDKTMVLTVVPDAGFAMLFADITEGQNPNTALLTPPAMDTITSIGNYGCSGMYSYCKSLTVAADMPLLTSIMNEGCSGMYSGCTSLTSAADMPLLTSIGGSGCSGMYNGCTSLTSAADMPLLTSIGDHGCFDMFGACTSLTSAADMPALTTIGNAGCGDMYSGCTFAMSSDGTTLNFAFPAPPVTAGGTTYATAYDIANWMGNTNGFTTP